MSPIHKQINFPALFRGCAVRDGYTSFRKDKQFNVLLASKLAALLQGKGPGKWLRGEDSLQVKQHKRGLRFGFFRGQILVQGIGTQLENWA